MKCLYCGREQSTTGRHCMYCGKTLNRSSERHTGGTDKEKCNKPYYKHKVTILIVVIVTFLVLVALFVLLIHIWTPATCTEPSICKICHKIKGVALGHDWAEATFAQPRTCLRCGTQMGDPLIPSNESPVSMHYYEEMYYDQTYVLNYTLRFSLDNLGRIKSVRNYNSNNELVASVEQDFDTDGNCTKKYEFGTNTAGLYLDYYNQYWNNGNLVKVEDSHGVYSQQFINDANGNPLVKYFYENDSLYMEDNFTYDELGRVSNIYRNNYGNWTTNIEYSYEGLDRKPTHIKWGEDEDLWYEYKYDNANRLVQEKETCYSGGELSSVMTKTYKYN